MQRRTILLLLSVAAAGTVAAVAAWRQWPVAAETAVATRGPVVEAVYATGTVEPTVMVPLAPRTGGRLAAVLAEEGERVRRGAVLARIESADLDQTVQEMRAREQLARTQYERTRELVAQKFVSPAELDRTRTELRAAEAAVRRAEAQHAYNQLVAPADGTVLRRDGEPGQFVAAGQAVLTLACCAPLRVAAEVDEEDIARVAVGQSAVLRTDALPGRLFDGTVAEITPKGDPVSRSYRVRIRLADAPAVDAGPLRTGMTMDVNVVVARREGALLVPTRALAGDAVWVVADGRLQRRAVRKGISGPERTELLAGVSEGDTVVLSPVASLREGQRVRARPGRATPRPPRRAPPALPRAPAPPRAARARRPPVRRPSRADAMAVALDVALAHLTGRKRQTLVSLTGIVLGVAFFLAVSSLMRGSEQDFIKRLVDNSPHVTVYDEVRQGRAQPAQLRWPDAAVAVRGVKPPRETRGIRGWAQRLAFVEALPGVRVAPVLAGAAVLTFAGREQAVTLTGAVPEKMKQVTVIEEKMTAGSLDALAADPNGVVIGQGLAEKFALHMGSTVDVLGADGASRPLRVVGIFRTGNAAYDEAQAFVLLKRAQSLLGRQNRVNRLIIQLADPYEARGVAQAIEAATGYKSVSWVEASEDVLSLLLVRNVIMYSVVSAILVVAAFGIYNTISTIVMEKTRDIAIMRAMGFHARDVRTVFLLEGLIVGVLGSSVGVLLGMALMAGLGRVEIRPPGVTEVVHLPVSWSADQYVLAITFAMLSCVAASYLPARRAGRVHPVDILRGAA